MKDRRQILLEAFKLLDLIIMMGAFALAAWLSFELHDGGISFKEFLGMRIKVQNFALFLGFLCAWRVLFSASGLYRSMRFSTRSAEIKCVMKATSVGTLALYVASLVFRISMMTPLFIALFWLISTTVTIASRVMLRRGLAWVRLKGRNLRFMLIVGTNKRAVRFARDIESRPELGYRLLGYVENGWQGNDEFKGNGDRVVSDFDGFSSFIREKVVDEVVFYLPMKSFYEQIATMAALCTEQGIIVRYPSDVINLELTQSDRDTFAGRHLTSHYTGAMQGWQIHLKRVMDVVLSSLSLLFLSPVFLMTALAIKFTSSGPVFFVHDRVGLNKRRFRLYKFRTMIQGAEKKQEELECLNEVCGPVFKIKDDPRITPIGRILRKLSIDELPQLINVVKGDMSLVGPRPLPVRDYNGFDTDWHRRRFSVRPGITCLWQVNGRSDTPFEQWMKLDMDYIDNWSLWLDIQILMRTIPAVLRGSGAA
jgi:exopolysaccharide biosynthesis polyprenyl glycosylphosphotransferase